MNLNPSNTNKDLAATTSFNPNKDIIIKGFWTENPVNVIVYEDEENVEHTITNLPAFFVPPIGGRIEIKVGTTVPLLIFL